MAHIFSLNGLRLVLVALVMCTLPDAVFASYLPINKNLTIKLSSLNSQGQLQAVSEKIIKSDAEGKVTLDFPSVPSANIAPFLHIQIMDGESVLRQTIVPSPQAGNNVDVGISETTDLHARAILKASAISGSLTPIHLLVAQSLIRTPTISITDAEALGVAIDAGVTAFKNTLASDNITQERLTTFLNSLSNGLADAAKIYRHSVDDSMFSDPNVEAYKRGEAFAVILQSLISAADSASINLETITCAYSASGAAAENIIPSPSNMSNITRISYISGILALSNYRYITEMRNSMSYVGVAPPTFTRTFDVLSLMEVDTIRRQKGFDKTFSVANAYSDPNALVIQEYNLWATQDLLLFKVMMEHYFFGSNSNLDATAYMINITSHMASMGGVMSGMTPESLMAILGRSTTYPELLLFAASVPSLRPYELAAWSYLSKEPSFTYRSISGLSDLLASKPAIPTYDKLGEPYKSIALLAFDVSLINSLRVEDYRNAEAMPDGRLSMATMNIVQENHRRRLNEVRGHISGVPSNTSDALIYLSDTFITSF